MLPEATSHPCGECPWTTHSARGWLGPMTAEEWLDLVRTDEPIACHETIELDGEWSEGTRQCAGAASFRKHIGKLPRDREVAYGLAREHVLASAEAFLHHHDLRRD